MATPSSLLAWRIPWIEEPGGLQSMGSKESAWLSVKNKESDRLGFESWSHHLLSYDPEHIIL